MEAAMSKAGIDVSSIPRQHFYELPEIDYALIARGYGVPSTRVVDEDQMEEAMDRMLGASGPFLIDLVLTPESRV